MLNKIKKHTMRITIHLYVTVSNKMANVCIKVKLRRVLATTVAKGEEKVLHRPVPSVFVALVVQHATCPVWL